MNNVRQIGAYLYRVNFLPARKARTISFRLTLLLGPAMAELISGGLDSLDKAFAVLSAGNNEALFASLCADLDATVQYDGKGASTGTAATVADPSGALWTPFALSADELLAGKPDEMLEVTYFALEVNFAGFFTGSLAARLKGKMAEVAASQAQAKARGTAPNGSA